MIFGIDFDGTCVSNNFPGVGEDLGADIVIKELLKNGHKVFIWTMRGHGAKDYTGALLKEDCIKPVEQWLISHGLDEVEINKNPEGQDWTDSPKQFAHYYIDDMSIGTPLMYRNGQNVVDWVAVSSLLHLAGALTYKQMLEIKYKLSYGGSL